MPSAENSPRLAQTGNIFNQVTINLSPNRVAEIEGKKKPL